MNNDLKKTMGHAGIYSIGVIMNRAVSFVMLPIYTRFLTPSDYGVLELLEITVDVISIITGMGIIQGLFKFYYQYETDDDKKELVSTMFLFIIILYACGCSVGGMYSASISSSIFGTRDYAFYILISFVNLFLSFLIYVPLAYVRTKQKSLFFVVISSIKLGIQLGLNILFVVHFKMGVLGVLYSTMIASLIIGALLTFYTFAAVGLHFSKQKATRLLKFGYPFVISGLGAFVLTFSDRYFLNYYNNISNVGIYSLGYKFGFLLAVFPIRPLFNIWLVQRFELVTEEGYEKTFNQFLSWFVIITMSVALFISLSVHDLLRIMSSPAFWDAYKIVPIILLAYFCQGCTDFFNFGIHYTEKTKHMAYGTTLSAAIIIAFSFLLIPKYGVFGAAWATLISFVTRLVYVYCASQKLFKINYKLGKSFGTIAICIAIYLVHITGVKWFPILSNLYLSGSFIVLLLLLFFTLLFVLNIIAPEERRVVLTSFKSPRKLLAEIRTQSV